MINIKTRPLEFIGSAKKDLLNFPKALRTRIGHELHLVQTGETPKETKTLKGFPGVMELVERYDKDTYRAVYVANLGGMVYVLHCFKKKSKRGIKTPKEDMGIIRQRLKKAKELSKEKRQ
jgi:phage-related protein